MIEDTPPAVIDGISKELGKYHFMNRRGVFLFADGVSYTMKEALILSKGHRRDLQGVHMVKKLIDGQILEHKKCRGRMWRKVTR